MVAPRRVYLAQGWACANGLAGVLSGCGMLELLFISLLGLAGGAFVGITDGDSEDGNGSAEGVAEADGEQEDLTEAQDGDTLLDVVSAQEAGGTDAVLPAESGNGDDDLHGDGQDNILRGHQGDDALYGRGGDDELYGNRDDDTLAGGEGSDLLKGGQGDDLLRGNEGDDSLSGGKGADTLSGGEGDGVLAGGGGNDTISGGDDDDTISGGRGDDRIWAREGNNLVHGGRGDDEIHGGYAVGSQLTAYGGDGDDLFTDSDGDSDLYGGGGNDEFHVGSGHNEVHGGQGDDTVFDGHDTDIIHGGAGNDALHATGTRVEGEVDQVYGGAGDDIIDQRGLTETWGGEGADHFRTYVNTWADTASTVMDYTPEEDTLEIQIEGHGYQELDDFEVSVEDFEDGTGASVFVDGVEILKVVGGQGMSVADLDLTVVETIYN